MSPEKIFNANNIDHDRRKTIGSVGINMWDEYAQQPKNPILKAFNRIIGYESMYRSYMELPLHEQTLNTIMEYIGERIPKNPDRVLDLGPGQNYHEISLLNQKLNPGKIVAADVSEGMLQKLIAGLKRENKKLVDKTYALHMDIGNPNWPKTFNFDDGNEDFGDFNFVYSGIVINWLTPEEQSEAMRNISEKTAKGGDVVLAFLNSNWSDKEVNKHVGEQLKINIIRTLAAAFESKSWAERATKSSNARRPTFDEITQLATDGLRVVDINTNIFFKKHDTGEPCAGIIHLRKI